MSDLSDYTKSVGTTLAVDADGQHRAALTVAFHSMSAEECRRLLDMLGLLPEHVTGNEVVSATDPPR